MKLTLRPYQLRGKRQTYDALARTKRPVVFVAPTGAGKTVSACSFAEDALVAGARVLYIAHREELILQPSRLLDRVGLTNHGIIKAGNNRIRPEAPIQIASIQTLQNRYVHMDMTQWGLVIVDEAHHAVADSYLRVLAACTRARIVGLTATPTRTDSRPLGMVFGSIVQVATVPQLIAEGFLVPMRVFEGDAPDMGGVRIVRGEFDEREGERRANTKRLVGNIVDNYLHHAAGLPFVAFCWGIDHSLSVRDRFRATGLRVEHIDCYMDDRTGAVAAFEAGELDGLTNYGVLTEGWDSPRVRAVILARATASEGLHAQILGRGLRPMLAPGTDRWAVDAEGRPLKAECVVLDHAGNIKRHGNMMTPKSYSLDGSGQVVETKGERKTGASLPGEKQTVEIVETDGLLREAGAGIRGQMPLFQAPRNHAREDTPEERARWEAELREFGRAKGWAPRAVELRIAARYGEANP